MHYGVSVGDGAVIGADSFLMKGEEVEPAARWAGNPAREVPEAAELPSLPAARRSAVVPLVLAGLVAVALPAGVTIGMTGTNVPFVRAAVTAPAPATSAVPATDAAGADTAGADTTGDDTADPADDEIADPTGTADPEEADTATTDEADDPAPTAAPTSAVRPAVARSTTG